ncbi:MAG: DNA methyltransferase [Bacteroidetes bacterium]|nr:DNA methyltransferase [Bacteroidota bacterium]
MSNEHIRKAKKNKNDEFYTQFSDIQNEMNAYLEYDSSVFKNKTILLPADDPEWSNFTKFFAQNFERFGLKKLISTSYAYESKKLSDPYQLSFFERESPKFDKNKTKVNGKIFILDRINKSEQIDINALQWDYLKGDGDFRSDEVKKLRDEADIIITNPPFSLFREFVSWILESEKKFIIVGHQNAISYKEIYPLIKDNIIWLGKGFKGGAAHFINKYYDDYAIAGDHKEGMIRVSGVVWFTNIDHGRRHQPLQLMTMEDNIKYSKHKEIRNNDYKKYDNYDAIDVPFSDAIPSDYKGIMGVPITFLNKYNPEQFEIIGFFNNYNPNTASIESGQIYGDAVKINTANSLFRGPVVNGKAIYIRVLIKKKN